MSNIGHIPTDQKVEVLIQALPWIEEFADQIVVVKFGGNAMVDEDLKHRFAEDIVFMKMVGLKPVVVHGGGPQISTMLAKLGIESEFKGGFRVTTPEAMDVVRMVLMGKIQREIVGAINSVTSRKHAYAVGMSGEDSGLFSAVKKPDLGLVGDISSVNPDAVLDLIDAGRIPIISSISPNADDPTEVMNVNADIAAGALAASLKARKLVVLTDVAGIYRNWPDESSLISQMTAAELEELQPSLASGMIPKTSACLDAVKNGVSAAHIIDGRIPHSLLTEVFTTEGIGTIIQPA
jgi:acetylglutamate kinase